MNGTLAENGNNVYNFSVGDDAFHRPERILHRITFRVDVGIDPYGFVKPTQDNISGRCRHRPLPVFAHVALHFGQ